MGFVHDEDFDTPDFNIDDIDRTDNVAQLLAWLEDTENAYDDMAAQVDAARHCGNAEEAWLLRVRGAMGFAGMGQTRLKKKLAKLGVNPHPRLPKTEREELAGQLNTAKGNLTKARSAAEFERHLLDSVKAHVAPEVVAVIISDAAIRASRIVDPGKEAA